MGGRVRFTRSAIGSSLLDQDADVLPCPVEAANRLRVDLVRIGRITESGLGSSGAGHHPP